METVTIIFADGTEISAKKNGDCFIIAKKRAFPEDLSVVTVSGADGDTVYHNAELVECASVDGKYWFSFAETPADKLALQRMENEIRTIATITDVDLDAPDPTQEISLKERINDLEIAICELVDALA